MSSITTAQAKKIGKLSRIHLTEEEAADYADKLSGILGWVEQLAQVNTDDVAQMTSVAAMQLPMRKDEVTDGGYQPQILSNAPANDYGCFVVPKVVE